MIASGPSPVNALDKTPPGVILVTLSAPENATYIFPDESVVISVGVSTKVASIVDSPVVGVVGVILLIFFDV